MNIVMSEMKVLQFPKQSVFWDDHTRVQILPLRNLHDQLIMIYGADSI